jgi:hypothetical protein
MRENYFIRGIEPSGEASLFDAFEHRDLVRDSALDLLSVRNIGGGGWATHWASNTTEAMEDAGGVSDLERGAAAPGRAGPQPAAIGCQS